MKLMKAGATGRSVVVSISDSTSTSGAKLTGLVFNSAGLVAYYRREGGSPVAITLATLAAANSAYSSGGFKELDAANMPGLYRLDLPDAAIAAGAKDVVVSLKGAANMVPVALEVALTSDADFDVNVTSQEGINLSSGVGPVPSLGIIDQGVLQSCTTAGAVLRVAAAFADNVLKGSFIQVWSATQAYHQMAAISANTLAGDAVTFETALLVAPTGALFYRIFGVPQAVAAGGLDAAGTRAALGMSSANLDTQLSSIAGFVDTEVAAIKAKTDQLVFGVANQLNVNVKSMNQATVVGTGVSGDKWRG